MFEVREIMVSVSPLERGLRGVLKLAIRRNDNIPPAPSPEGKSYSPVIKERFISLQCNLFTDMAGFSFAIFFHNFIFVV